MPDAAGRIRGISVPSVPWHFEDAPETKRVFDSPRYCDVCKEYGDHHTDRHPPPLPKFTETDLP